MKLWFDTVVPLGAYQEELRSAVLRMKHAQGDPLSEALGELLAIHRGDQLAALQPDLAAPIPRYWWRRVRQGTNSPEILAQRLAKRLGVPAEPRLLACRRNVRLQQSLKPRDRFRNVRGAFRVNKGYDLENARMLLVDDVLTTGATCNEAAKMLKQAGAAYVAVAVLARAEGDN